MRRLLTLAAFSLCPALVTAQQPGTHVTIPINTRAAHDLNAAYVIRVEGNINVDEGINYVPSRAGLGMRLMHIACQDDGQGAYIQISVKLGCNIESIDFWTVGRPNVRVVQGRELTGRMTVD